MKVAKKASVFFLLIVMMLMGSGCVDKNNSTDTDLPGNSDKAARVIVYTIDDGITGQANMVSVDLSDFKLSINDKKLFLIKMEYESFRELYPFSYTNNYIVFPSEPTEKPDCEYVVSSAYKNANGTIVYSIWNGIYRLDYDENFTSASLYKKDELVGTINDLKYNESWLVPEMFYVEEDGDKITVLCSRTGNEEDMPDIYENYITSFSATLKDGNYEIGDIKSYGDMFSEDLSIIHSPAYSADYSNIYAVNSLKKFIWNEGRNIVVIDPATGKYEVILTEDSVLKDMPQVDTTNRESYGFFGKAVYQDGYYLIKFPNYNALNSEYIAFYNDEMKYSGSILVSEGSIALLDENNQEVDRIDNPGIKPAIYIPNP